MFPLCAGKRNEDLIDRYTKRKHNMRGLRREANDATAQARQALEQAKAAQKHAKTSEERLVQHRLGYDTKFKPNPMFVLLTGCKQRNPIMYEPLRKRIGRKKRIKFCNDI